MPCDIKKRAYGIRTLYDRWDNKLVTIEFNTPVNVYKEWEDVANEVMDSICFNEDDIKKYSSD